MNLYINNENLGSETYIMSRREHEACFREGIAWGWYREYVEEVQADGETPVCFEAWVSETLDHNLDEVFIENC